VKHKLGPLAGLMILAHPALAQVVVTFPDARVFLSPYAWRTASGAAICPTGGCYIRFTVTGTTQITVNADTTLNSALSANDMPSIKVIVNTPTLDGTAAYIQFPANNTASTAVTLASGMSSGTTYTVLLSAIGGNQASGNGWTGTSFQTKINSLSFDSGATVSIGTQRPKNILFIGDSYLQAYYGGSQSGAYYTCVDFTLSWPFFASFAFNGEYGQVGVGSQGWVLSGQGGYPNLPSSWNSYDSTHAKTFSPAPDYVFISEGTNDHGQSPSTVTANVTSTLIAMRTAFGASTKIFIVIPLDQQQVSAITAGVSATGDKLIGVLNGGTQYANTVFAGAATWASPDGLHLDSTHGAIWSAFIIQQATAFGKGPCLWPMPSSLANFTCQ
jgi:lysophospholipase L1-like esterase